MKTNLKGAALLTHAATAESAEAEIFWQRNLSLAWAQLAGNMKSWHFTQDGSILTLSLCAPGGVRERVSMNLTPLTELMIRLYSTLPHLKFSRSFTSPAAHARILPETRAWKRGIPTRGQMLKASSHHMVSSYEKGRAAQCGRRCTLLGASYICACCPCFSAVLLIKQKRTPPPKTFSSAASPL